MAGDLRSCTFFVSVLIICTGDGSLAMPDVRNKLIMARSATKDLESSATGYIYTSNAHGPVQYLHLAEPQGGGYQQEVTDEDLYYQLGGSPQPHGDAYGIGAGGRYIGSGLGGGYVVNDGPTVGQNYEPAREYPVPKPVPLLAAPVVVPGGQYQQGGSEEYAHGVQGGNSGGGYQDGSFEKGGGSSFNEGHHAQKGNKGSSGYQVYDAYDKGEKGNKGSEQNTGFYDENSGHKKSFEDAAGLYDEHHHGEKGHKGANFGENGSRKKGYKTTGFHNVYHKDEYKKDHEFYDTEDESGFFNKGGDFESSHAAQGGGFKKGSRLDAAHSEDEQAKKGSYDKGSHFGEARGHDKQEGSKVYHGQEEDYAAKKGQGSASSHGYSKGEEGLGHYGGGLFAGRGEKIYGAGYGYR